MQYAPRPARNVPRNLSKGMPPRFHKLSAHPGAQGIREFRQTSNRQGRKRRNPQNRTYPCQHDDIHEFGQPDQRGSS